MNTPPPRSKLFAALDEVQDAQPRNVTPAPEWAQEVATFQAPYLSGAVMRARGYTTPEGYAQAVRGHLRDLFSHAEVWVRTHPNCVAPILQDELRNVFYTRRIPHGLPTRPTFKAEDLNHPVQSAKLLDAMAEYNRSGAYMLDRLRMEEKAFNIPRASPASVRPVYGYFSEDADARLLTTPRLRMLDGFGRVALRLSRDVRPFTTACGFDLVGMTLPNLGPMELPRGTAPLLRAGDAPQSADLTGSPGYPVAVERMTEHAWAWAYHCDPLTVTRLDSLPWHAEAQIHAPVYGRHIQEIVTTERLPIEALTEAERLGIPVRQLHEEVKHEY